MMDKRKLRLKGGLHKNLIGSQIASQSHSSLAHSGSSLTLRVSNERHGSTLSQKTVLTCKEKSSKDETQIGRSKLSNSEILSHHCKFSNDEILCRKSQLSENETSRKRKSSSLEISSNDAYDDLGLPLAESTVLKKRKDDSRDLKEIHDNSNRKAASINRSITSKKSTNVAVKKTCKFTELLLEAGIMLNTDGPHMLTKDLVIIQKNMKELLRSECYKKAEVIKLIEKYVENEQNLENALNDMEIPINSEVSNILHSSSLIKTLLQVPELYPEICTVLLSKLNESVLLADSMESAPWTYKLLQQFRFLDVVTCPDSLTNSLEPLLESCPTWFQTELILFLPDIITDKQHQPIAEILNRLLEENSELTNVILNCMSNLNLGKKYLEEHKGKVLNLLKTNLQMNAIPAIIKFVLEDCTNHDIFKKTLSILRTIDIQPLAGEKLEDCYRNQLNIIDTLKMSMLFSKDIVNTTTTVIRDITKDPKPLDIILLLLIFSTTEAKRKSVETIFKQHIRSGFYRQSLLSLLYSDYKKIVQELQSPALQLTSNLLRTDERVFIDFAIDWLRLQFMCHKDAVFKQREILETILFLMGDNEQTVKNALMFLCKMAENEEERLCLSSHCNHLRILLEKMENLGLEEVGTLNDLLHNICTNSSFASGSLRDELFIVLQKQLSNFKPLTKCKGVLGAVMAIKHLMGKAETSSTAYNLFKTVLNNVKHCPKSQALFYDQLSDVITNAQDVNLEFITNLFSYIEEEFVSTYMTDTKSYRGDLIPKFGLNDRTNEPEDCVLNFEDQKYGAMVPISFKLLRTCCLKLSKNGELDTIDSLLGCSILMPENLDIAEHSVLDLVICCINWFREVISGFVMQTDSLLRKQVLQRLDNLIYLQSELSTLFSLSDIRYQPPPCYFHHFPVPPFVRHERKIGKKGKKSKKKGKNASMEKSLNYNESESWELGSAICSKNPTYFRKLEATVVHLLDIKMGIHASQSTTYSISLQQVCFLVKELLGYFEHESKETFVRDLINLLPKICSKLQDIVDTVREDPNSRNREGIRLLLCLLTKIFNWKGFESVTYNALLRDGLRTLAGQLNESNVQLRSCKELVAESYKYIESLSDIVTQVTLAFTLVNMFESLMKHSESYTKQYKEKHAQTAFGFLCLEWPEDKHFTPQYKTAVNGLLKSWMDNEPLPLNTVTEILEWLPDEAAKLEKPQDFLNRIPTIRKNSFHSLYKKLFEGLIKGVKIALSIANRDPARITIWHQAASDVHKLIQISKTLRTKSNILIFLKYMPVLLRVFINVGMPVLEHNLKYQTEDVTSVVKMMQGGTRYLHTICCDSAEKKDITLTRFVPAAKSILERLLFSVKGMLVLNNSPTAFWMGNLVNKNLDGREILSQRISTEELDSPSSSIIPDNVTNASSEVFDSASSDDLDDEYDGDTS